MIKPTKQARHLSSGTKETPAPLNGNEIFFKRRVAECLEEIRHRALVTEEVHEMLCDMFQANSLTPSANSEPSTTEQESTK